MSACKVEIWSKTLKDNFDSPTHEFQLHPRGGNEFVITPSFPGDPEGTVSLPMERKRITLGDTALIDIDRPEQGINDWRVIVRHREFVDIELSDPESTGINHDVRADMRNVILSESETSVSMKCNNRTTDRSNPFHEQHPYRHRKIQITRLN